MLVAHATWEILENPDTKSKQTSISRVVIVATIKCRNPLKSEKWDLKKKMGPKKIRSLTPAEMYNRVTKNGFERQ